MSHLWSPYPRKQWFIMAQTSSLSSPTSRGSPLTEAQIGEYWYICQPERLWKTFHSCLMMPKDTWNEPSVISISTEAMIHHGTNQYSLSRGSPLSPQAQIGEYWYFCQPERLWKTFHSCLMIMMPTKRHMEWAICDLHIHGSDDSSWHKPVQSL